MNEKEKHKPKQESQGETCNKSIPRVADPNRVGSSPFSARSYMLYYVRSEVLYPISFAT